MRDNIIVIMLTLINDLIIDQMTELFPKNFYLIYFPKNSYDFI